MVSTERVNMLQVNNTIKVKKSILQRIQMLVDTDKNKSFIENKDTIGAVNLAVKKLEISTIPTPDLYFWNINEKCILINECSHDEIVSNISKNSFPLMMKHLEDSFGDNFLVLGFKKTGVSKSYKRAIFLDIDGYNLHKAHEISQIVKLWLDTGSSKVIVIELREDIKNYIFFTVSCILAYCKFFWTAELALNSLKVEDFSRSRNFSLDTTVRYVKYYDKISTANPIAKYPEILLNQVIMTTIPSIVKNRQFTPYLTIASKDKSFQFSTENCYKDTNYIVFSNLDVVLCGDAVVSVHFEDEKKKYQILDLPINTFCYQQGLFRFNRSEIETLLPNESIYQFFDNDFSLDLVFLENRAEAYKNPLSASLTVTEIVKKISSLFIGYFDEILYNKYINLNFEVEMARVCTLLKLKEEESLCLSKKVYEATHKISNFVTFEPKDTKPESANKSKQIGISLHEKPTNLEVLYAHCELKPIEDIAYVEDYIPVKATSKKQAFGLFAKKTEVNLPINHEFTVSKMLHMVSISNTENTIFSEIKDLNISIDYEAFESVFCHLKREQVIEKKEIQIKQTVLSEKRLFIVSLAIKQLQIKKINFEGICGILDDNPRELEIEDINSLLKILPTDEEAKMLESVDMQNLLEVEKTMLEFSKIQNVGPVLRLLFFEKNFLEEILSIETLLNKANMALDRIMTDIIIKNIFKSVLDISNLFTYTYGTKKKALQGFRLDSLYFFSSYVSAKQVTLLDFTVETLQKNKINCGMLDQVFKDLIFIKNEDFTNLKDKINTIIDNYNETVTSYKSVRGIENSCFTSMISFSNQKLCTLKVLFNKFQEQSFAFRHQYGEDDKKSISDIASQIFEFLGNLMKTENKRSKKKI